MLTVAHLDEQDTLRGGEQQATWLVRGLLDQGVRCLVIGRPDRPFISMHPEEKELIRVPLPLRGAGNAEDQHILLLLRRADGAGPGVDAWYGVEACSVQCCHHNFCGYAADFVAIGIVQRRQIFGDQR